MVNGHRGSLVGKLDPGSSNKRPSIISRLGREVAGEPASRTCVAAAVVERKKTPNVRG